MNESQKRGNGTESHALPAHTGDGFVSGNGSHPEDEELLRRIRELEGIAEEIHESRRAALNLLEDVEEARRVTEELNRSLKKEIAERERAQAQLEAELADTRLLQGISAEIIHEENVEALYDKIMEAAAEIMHSDFASLQMLYPKRGPNGELRLLACRGFSPEAATFWEWVQADSECSCGIALRTGQRAIVPDLERCDFMAGTQDLEIYLQTGIHAAQSTPLFSRNGEVLGMISTHWRAPHEPAGRDLQLLDILARQAADLIERNRAEEALRKSEARFRALVSQATAGISTADFSGRFLFVNERYCEIVGYRAEELLEMRMQDLTHPEDLSRNLVQFRALAEGGPDFVIEKRYRRKDGREVWVTNTVTAIRSVDQRLESVVAVTLDITERKRAEEATLQRNRQLAVLARSSQELVFGGQPEGVMLRTVFENVREVLGMEFFVNFLTAAEPRTLRLVSSGGLSQEQKDFFATIRFGEHLCGAVAEKRERIIVENLPDCGFAEADSLRKAGVKCYGGFPLLAHGRLLGTIAFATSTRESFHESEVQMIQTVCDQVAATLDRVRLFEELGASEERFRQFAENSTDVFWIIDGRTRRLEYLNPVYEKMFGESREPIMRDLGRWLELIHPEDRDQGVDMLSRLLAGENVTIDYRIIRPNDGAIRWIRDSGFLIRDEAGAVSRVAGVLQDITKDKESSEALRESEERFRLLVEGAPDYAMFLLDPGNQIIYWSSGAERVFGWSANEVLGQSGELVFTREDRARKQEEKEIRTALRKGVASDRRWHLRKDGSRVWIDGVIRRLDDEKGNLRGFAKIARDATETHRAEEALQHSHLDLERRVRERTAELTALNKKLQREMKERAQVEQELLLVSEREKRRIGQDLHDSLCQELAAAALFLQTAAQKMEKKTPAGAKALSNAARIVNDNVGLARDLARGLHPVELTSAGLANALRELAFRTSQARAITCHCECARRVRVRDEGVVLNLYRIAQEAVTNAIKNGKATVITIRLARHGDAFALTVKDNGKGFSTSKSHQGMGLHIMKYRADVIGARLTVESTDGKGTLVSCLLPNE